MSDNTNKPLGYGHDNKGAAGGTDLNKGKPAVAHTAPVDKVDGAGKAETAKTFFIDGHEIDIRDGESIFKAARRLDIKLPHLCYSPKPGYRADGNCRVCMVEIEGERVLAASCIRNATPGMKVKTDTHRAKTARKMVAELLLTDQPAIEVAHDTGLGILENRQAPEGRSRPLSRSAKQSPCRRPTAAIRQWRSISTPASSAICASAPAAKCRSTTSSAWPAAAISKRSCSISTTRWAPALASVAANACRPVRPAP